MIAYALSTQLRSLSDAPNPDPMAGSATFTIHRSRLIMKTAATTVTTATRRVPVWFDNPTVLVTGVR